MKKIKKLLCVLLAAVTLMAAAALAAPRAWAEDYEDGTYTVSLSFEGGTGKVIWNSPVTITVKDGELYADFVMSKPSGSMPSVEWMECSGVRYTADRNTSAGTCSFYDVWLPNLGTLVVSANTTAMSEEHVVDYTLYIDDSTIPVKQAAQPDPQPTTPTVPTTPTTPTTPGTPAAPTVPSTPGTPGTPSTPGTAEPSTPDTPAEPKDSAAFEDYRKEQKEAIDKLTEEGDSEAAKKLIEEAGETIDALTYDESKSLEENEKALTDILTKLETDLTAQREKDSKESKDDQPAEDTAPIVPAAEKKGLSTGAIIGIVAAVAVIAAGAYVLLRKKK